MGLTVQAGQGRGGLLAVANGGCAMLPAPGLSVGWAEAPGRRVGVRYTINGIVVGGRYTTNGVMLGVREGRMPRSCVVLKPVGVGLLMRIAVGVGMMVASRRGVKVTPDAAAMPVASDTSRWEDRREAIRVSSPPNKRTVSRAAASVRERRAADVGVPEAHGQPARRRWQR